MNFFLLSLANVGYSSAFGLQFKTVCTRLPDVVAVSSIAGWLWEGCLDVSARHRHLVGIRRLMGRERETDLGWFKWGVKQHASQGSLRSCPEDCTASFTEMKPSSGWFQPSSGSQGETSRWLQHDGAITGLYFSLVYWDIFSFGINLLLQQFNCKFQSFWTALEFNLPTGSWQFPSRFAVIKNESSLDLVVLQDSDILIF